MSLVTDIEYTPREKPVNVFDPSTFSVEQVSEILRSLKERGLVSFYQVDLIPEDLPKTPVKPKPEPLWVWVVPEANPEQCVDIRAQVRLAQEDPNYSIITNFQFSWVKVFPGDIVVVEEGTADQVDFLRAELAKVWNEDPAYIVVLPFKIAARPAPTSA